MSAPSDPPAAPGDRATAPGGPDAVSRGCLCSVLANAAYRARAEEHPFVDPDCPVHATRETAAS